MATASAKKDVSEEPISSRIATIVPPRTPQDVISYREVPESAGDLVGNADSALKLMAYECRDWLLEEADKLDEAWQDLQSDPDSPKSFRHYHRAIHTMYGNAGTLGCPAATQIARPIACLLERAPGIEPHLKLIGLATASIIAAIEEKLDETDPRVIETTESLEAFLARWLDRTG